MKSVIINEFGSPGVLEVVQHPSPEARGKNVLIDVVCAGINPVDAKIRSGKHISCSSIKFPYIPGKELSGIIIAVGEEVESLRVGDEVFGFVSSAYAEQAVADELSLVLKPRNFTFQEAGGAALAALTAYQAINEHLQVQRGQKVLIQSAAGGVGHIAAQLASLLEAYVYGTASEANLAFLREIGVDRPIDYHKEQFDDVEHSYDCILETMGGESLYRAIKSVRPGGRVVCLPSSTMDDPKAVQLAKERGVTLLWFMVEYRRAELNILADLFGQSKLKVHVQQEFPAGQVRAAHEMIESHHVRGKIVLRLDPRIHCI